MTWPDPILIRQARPAAAPLSASALWTVRWSSLPEVGSHRARLIG